MTKIITKFSGDKEPFDVSKFQRSIRRAGANESQVRDLTRKVLDNPKLNTTKDIYDFAFNYLREENPPIAARYSLRAAISMLGPSGFPFEQFIAEVFKGLGYTTQTDQIMNGYCVSHEIDVVLQKDGHTSVAECKFHHEHLIADIKVPLYIKARFDDLCKAHKNLQNSWVITNTKFSSDAIAYGTCVGLNLLSWSYPANNSLARIIDRLGLHPITVLTSLSNKQKQMLLDQNVVMCQNMDKERAQLKSIGLTDHEIENVVHEAHAVCKLGAIDHDNHDE